MWTTEEQAKRSGICVAAAIKLETANFGDRGLSRVGVEGVVVDFVLLYTQLLITSGGLDTNPAMSFLIPLIKPLAYASLPLFVVQRIAIQQTPSPLRYYARLVVYVGTLFTVASCSFVAAVGMTLIGRPYETNLLVARMFYTIVHRALDLQVEVEGEEYLEAKPAVFMSNHQSMIDVVVLGR